MKETKDETERERLTTGGLQFEGKSYQREIRMKCEIIIQSGINCHLTSKEAGGGEEEN